ncbi:mitochondrial ribosomal S35, putative [Babesia ovata]|uniref:Mitochondrial ribosomal S35, putative n=1 Tax=Babesia ovata TaxID=189622 RepID=A0A2H6K6X1_9APIC|nr:mitochondrial ribosomal S35, putative [Babesia ovata]GBE58731.1 mitochondrial ribosomal S35, putative [Babesia ovata]
MGKKKRRKVEKVTKSKEQIECATSDVIRLHDRVGVPETAHSMAQTIRKNVRGVQQGIVTRKHIARMLQYRMAQATGLTHDSPPRNAPDAFVTPLTRLQHEAQLPTMFDQPRHDFPHVLRYTVDWLAEASPGEHEKLTKVTLSFNMHDLGLSEMQLRKMKEILGPDNYDEASGVAILQGDIFETLNHNAHYLGDITERLMRAVRE